ncbi:MAG TPA: hypothetical protein VHD37_00910 [Candidatus Paceibacterota bacterium]|nr:hypothetical protein [Candidatus Paceibacterota bacterium]
MRKFVLSIACVALASGAAVAAKDLASSYNLQKAAHIARAVSERHPPKDDNRLFPGLPALPQCCETIVVKVVEQNAPIPSNKVDTFAVTVNEHGQAVFEQQ